MKRIIGMLVLLALTALPVFANDDDPPLEFFILNTYVEIFVSPEGMDSDNSITGFVAYISDGFIYVEGDDGYDWIFFIHDIAAIRIIER